MKNLSIITIMLVFGLVWSLSLTAQEMPIHSKSPEAVQILRNAMEQIGHDMPFFGESVEKALELDEEMYLPNVFSAFRAKDMKNEEMFGKYMAQVTAYKGELSEGERLFAQMLDETNEETPDNSPIAQQLVDLYPEDAAIHLMAGFMFAESKKFEKANAMFTRVIELKDLPAAYNMMGYAYMRSGQLEKAKTAFETYQKIAPDHANPYDSMGDYLMAVKEYEAAAQSFEKAASLNKNFTGSAKKAVEARKKLAENK